MWLWGDMDAYLIAGPWVKRLRVPWNVVATGRCTRHELWTVLLLPRTHIYTLKPSPTWSVRVQIQKGYILVMHTLLVGIPKARGQNLATNTPGHEAHATSPWEKAISLQGSQTHVSILDTFRLDQVLLLGSLVWASDSGGSDKALCLPG